MIKALLLIVSPGWAWERVVRNQRSFTFILMLHLLPLLALGSIGEGYGLVHWGRSQKDGFYVKKFTTSETAVFEIAQVLLGLGIVLFGARILKSLGETFHGRHTYAQAFTVAAYGLSPLFLLRLACAFPSASPWVGWAAWAIGILLSLEVLYQGVPRVMQPDPPHAFGLFLTSALLLVMATGLAQFVTAWYLQGRFKSLDAIVSALASRLPF
jgi:Yip1 domain